MLFECAFQKFLILKDTEKEMTLKCGTMTLKGHGRKKSKSEFSND